MTDALIALSSSSCASCHGTGTTLYGRDHTEVTCACVDRAVFRAVLGAYNFYGSDIGQSVKSVMTRFDGQGPRNRQVRGPEKTEYVASVHLVARRNLSPNEWLIWTRHYINGENWARFKMDRGNFFHACYRIEQKLGKLFRELTPYALYPIADYFARTLDPVRPCPIPPVKYPNGQPLVPPLAVQPVLAIPPVRPKPVPVRPVPVPVVQTSTLDDAVRSEARRGISWKQIATNLAKQGYPPPSGGNCWKTSELKSILLKRAA